MAAPVCGKLWVVATPIGNLDDVSLRAARVLAEADLVAAEDTRRTRQLLTHLGLSRPLVSYRDANETAMTARLLERLLGGESIALVSDAGTPAISDPGYRLVRAAAAAGVEVVAVPGPSAVTALLCIAGLPTDRFVFEGFPPTAEKARARTLERLRGCGATVVFYESPRRVAAFLAEVAAALDDPEVAVGRELTKLHEEVLRGRASEVSASIAAGTVRGEFAIAVHVERADDRLEGAALEREVAALLAAGVSVRDCAARLAASGARRRDVYAAARKLRGED